jgi:hypothetical protein
MYIYSMVNKKKKTTKKPKIYQKQKQNQNIKISIDNSKKTSKGARKATTTPSSSVIYLGSNQAPQPFPNVIAGFPVQDRFPYFFPHQEQKSLPEVATNVSSTLLGQKLGELPKNISETLRQNNQFPEKSPSEATTEKMPEKKVNKQTTMTDFYKVNHKRKQENFQSSSSSVPQPTPKKTRKPRLSKLLPNDQPKISQVLPPLAKEVETMQIAEPKDSQHYWG